MLYSSPLTMQGVRELQYRVFHPTKHAVARVGPTKQPFSRLPCVAWCLTSGRSALQPTAVFN